LRHQRVRESRNGLELKSHRAAGQEKYRKYQPPILHVGPRITYALVVAAR
jgi:hypothetical protein